ncbi:hypothetical protein AG1IA_04391 [Rhizoctonia solani AG-1 IA]|uniref:Uncharacterized protein n=1 Tax=Thanatephorus cucumeris (strain AG1-IA) TaxID=983506 RepID=L8WU98_THACA|nr:hypothetical protein AG1IA_04391 [Rhizoctonia solani AG-1 IA]
MNVSIMTFLADEVNNRRQIALMTYLCFPYHKPITQSEGLHFRCIKLINSPIGRVPAQSIFKLDNG